MRVSWLTVYTDCDHLMSLCISIISGIICSTVIMFSVPLVQLYSALFMWKGFNVKIYLSISMSAVVLRFGDSLYIFVPNKSHHFDNTCDILSEVIVNLNCLLTSSICCFHQYIILNINME